VGELLERHRAQVGAWCRRAVGHEATAEDLTQEVLVRAFQRFASLREEASLLPWLRRITQRVCANWQAREREATEYVGLLDSDEWRVTSDEVPDTRHALPDTRHPTRAIPLWGGSCTPDPLEALLRAETQAEVRAALAHLPADVQAAVRLFYLEGGTLNEVAARLECSPTTVKSRLQIGRQRLRKELAHMDTSTRPRPQVAQRRQRLERQLAELGTEEGCASWRALLERELAELDQPPSEADPEILPAATVWLVEDPQQVVTTSGETIAAAREELRWHGFQARVVQKAANLAERLRRDPPDILVVSDEVAGLDPWALLRDLKVNRHTRSIAVCILLTRGEDGQVANDKVFRAWQAGVDCCLTKPFNLLEFSQFIRRTDDAMKAYDLMILATDHAWRGELAEALVGLRQAVRKGGPDTARKARDNPAFRPLHTDPEFRALVGLDEAAPEGPAPPVAQAVMGET
jgi:RNA polymerase sigma-70 factor (ECF subfamily)